MNKGAMLVKDPAFKCILGRRRGPSFCEPTPAHPSQDSFSDLEWNASGLESSIGQLRFVRYLL